ncbi:MAG: NnrU family protein [Alphaproteobacteria bacterium]|nr:NnrU family protein [Alphaproteobacteria bacterium]
MPAFAIALGSFIFLHVGVSATGLRAALTKSMGEGIYRGAFSLASAAVLVWVVVAYGDVREDPLEPLNSLLYLPPAWGRHAAQGLMLLAFLLGVTGLLTPGPTQVGFEGALNREEPAKGVLRITRHPFLWSVAIWATGHLLANGERAAVMLFGGLGLMVLFGTRSIDRKGAARNPEGWAKFAAVTSNIPFAAILQGRNRLAIGEMWWRVLVAAVAYLGVAWAHGAVFGVPAVP